MSTIDKFGAVFGDMAIRSVVVSQPAPIPSCHALRWESEFAERVWRRVGLAGPAGQVQP